MRFEIIVSDPWELGEAVLWRPLEGTVISMEDNECGGCALVRLDAPLEWRGAKWRYVVVSPRYARDEISSVATGSTIVGGFTGISDEHAASRSPFDLTKWRAGLAFIADFRIAK